MSVNKASTLFYVLLGMACLNTEAAIQVTPEEVIIGKPGQITISHPDINNVAAITLNPGGPYLQHSLPLKNNSSTKFAIEQNEKGLRIIDKRSGEELARFNNEAAKTGASIAGYNTADSINDVATQGKISFVASNNGLTLLDVNTPNKPVWLGSHQKLGQVVRVIASGKYIYALNNDGIVYSLDVNNPVEPTTQGAYRSKKSVQDISANGELVFIRHQDSIDVINFSGKTPYVSNEGLDFGQGANLGGERRIFIEDNLAYVADWFSGIHIYDISQPQRPILLSSFHTPGSPKGIAIRDGIAFVADDDYGLQIVDVSDPLNPKFVSELLTRGLAYTPKIVDELLYLAGHRGGFQIVDISDAHQAKLISEYDTPGKAWSIEVKNNIAYIADDDSGLLIFNVRNPQQPELIGQFSPGTAAEEIIVRDNIAFVAFFDDGLYILDISRPQQPKIISHTDLPGNTRGLDLVDNKLYVASWLAGVHILDISDLKSPLILGAHDTRGAAWGLKARNNFLYVMDWWGGFSILDISDSTSPLAAGSYHNDYINDVVAKDNYIFVANGNNGLQVFDIKNPLHPTWMTGAHFSGQAQQLALSKETAFVATGFGGLAIVDISNPFNVRWLSSIKTPGKTLSVHINDDIAYIVDSAAGIIVYDIKQARKPKWLYRLDIKANDLLFANNLLYVATRQGLTIYNTGSQKSGPIKELAINGGLHKLKRANEKILAATKNRLLLLDNKLELLDDVELDQTITDIVIDAGGFFASTEDSINLFSYNNNSGLILEARYPMLSHIRGMEFHNGIIYTSGEKNITALQPLPVIKYKPLAKNKSSLSLPETLGEGHYNLQLTLTNGDSKTLHNAINVKMPAFSKPKMTLEDFKKIMKERKNKDLFTTPAK